MNKNEMIIESIKLLGSLSLESLQKARLDKSIPDNLIRAIDLMIELKRQ